MTDILQITELSEVNASMIINCKKPLSKTEYHHIYCLLSTHSLDNKIILKVIELLFKTEFKPIYSNEIKLFLRENHKEMYEQYEKMFRKNPGVAEAFNKNVKINRLPYELPDKKPQTIKFLEPKFIGKKLVKRKKDNFERKQIRRSNKQEAVQKIKKLIQDKKEYEQKVKEMYRKLN
ncbi:hypothetical protein EDEG_03178 [Edhazardia aedis USNM 41457]|uniref:Uncharacterized protein n=1 Tax=Edhazardia aedis (strain USNM 41457) TaxID=1003232 RepID=J9DLY1_EDHAE|nr:hypothetical protein EDEG_03178 [Edhazardia aedis USNM 41457]|eukprot:EJW02392.1 hypothetical protein EDEG_03178 [Edhazardia aedis USNM 41457]